MDTRELYALCDRVFGATQSQLKELGTNITKSIRAEFEQNGIPLYDPCFNEDGEERGRTDSPDRLLAISRVLDLIHGHLSMAVLFAWILGDEDEEQTA